MSIQTILGDKGREVATISADARLSEAVRVLGERRIGALPVVEGDRIVGIMSERDVIYCLKDHGAEVLDWPVSRVMTSPAITVDPSTEVAERIGPDHSEACSALARCIRAAGLWGSSRSATW